MKRQQPLKRPKKKKGFLRLITWNGTTYQGVHIPEHLADDFIREFVLTEVPGTTELEFWIASKTHK